eukprot:5882410-Pleurochrysis_carterae.AAC.2
MPVPRVSTRRAIYSGITSNTRNVRSGGKPCFFSKVAYSTLYRASVAHGYRLVCLPPSPSCLALASDDGEDQSEQLHRAECSPKYRVRPTTPASGEWRACRRVVA